MPVNEPQKPPVAKIVQNPSQQPDAVVGPAGASAKKELPQWAQMLIGLAGLLCIVFIIRLLIGGGGTKDNKPVRMLTASQLCREYGEDDKFFGKILDIEGDVYDVKDGVINLEGAGDIRWVQCLFSSPKDVKGVGPRGRVCIRGKCGAILGEFPNRYISVFNCSME
jgi:hypothetical protein